ncbi:prolyl aminopeptidase [Glaciecola sp. MH2013]|uniref:prolyl aminopeptidase n=1 Tax=Glaciecola sp. MH2013 TaxID=2785524 RepID=UPI00189E4E57|nr:prolyl aminopeptidase [Glaciecola sp. MH2013]MBF7073845.1 prolyl aminopeptidase [Glaciecola sp. MH2013]
MDGIFHTNAVYHKQMIDVAKGHKIYVEQSGNPEGIPLLYLHGGPGAGLGKNYQWPFDPLKYRVIGIEQRGCGRSTPFGDTQHNTTALLLDDIEVVRKQLKIHSWVVFGGSWGSTLALLYAIASPSSVISLVLRGVFLARQEDFDWFLRPTGCAAQIYPEAYENFSAHVDDLSSSNKICQQFIELFNSDLPAQSFAALKSWYDWEGFISRLIPPQILSSDLGSDSHIKSLALLECHYLLNKCFIPENYILDNSSMLSDFPCHIVHGRYDMVCKVESAYALHKALPLSTLKIVNNAGHSMSEVGIANELTRIMNSMFEFGSQQ